MRPPRLLAAPAVLLCALLPLVLLAGCHHRPSVYDSSLPAPPPTTPAETASPPPAHAAASRPVTRPTAKPAPKPAQINLPPNAAEARITGRLLSTETGLASWYGPPYHNHQAADGSIFDQNAMTAAHRTLPMGTTVRVTNLATGESVVVKITDRGPFVPNRILDLSLAAAKATGLYQMGVGQVRVEAYARDLPDDGGRWCVQIGVFLDPAESLQLKNDLTSRYGSAARVTEFTGPTGHWVRVNPVASDRATAQRIVDSIHIPVGDPYLVRLN